MNITKHHITEYLTGELPYSEQHELEKMMLEDPFLSDAIEGLQEINDPEKLNEALLEIEGLIESNYGKRKVLVPIYKNPLAIAAVISLLIISVAIVLLVPDYRQKVQSFLISGSEMKDSELPESRKQEELITEKEEPVEEQIASPESGISPIEEEQPTLTTLDTDPGSEDLVETTPIEEPARLAITDTTNIDEENLLIAEEEAPPITPIIVDSISTTLATNDLAGKADQVEEITVAEAEDEGITGDFKAAAKRAAPESQAQLQETPLIKEVSGLVTSAANNQPIAGVNVILGGTPKGTITDANGRYNLQIDEGINTIQFSYIGFRPTNLNLTN
ncbi:MAG: hypothetical protein HKN67_08295, partial [Saprospiraceae bacterium]|nr:hypothetical protein [Saprospiraceae bacterium]